MDKKTFGRILAKRLLEASDALASWPVPDGQPDRNIRLQLGNSLWQAALSAGQMGGVTIRQARRVEPELVVTLQTAQNMVAAAVLLQATRSEKLNSRLLKQLAAAKNSINGLHVELGRKEMATSNSNLLEELASCRDLIAEFVAATGCISPSGALKEIEHWMEIEKLKDQK